MSNSGRETQLNRWAVRALSRHNVDVPATFSLSRVSDDASFRRYFRGIIGGESYIFVDAPPAQEDSQPFVDVAARLISHGLNAPRVIEADLADGFMMLSDLGDEVYLSYVVEGNESTVERLYSDALASLIQMQKISAGDLPAYDELRLREEMNLFPDWFLGSQLDMSLADGDRDLLEDVFTLMIDNARAQPEVFVHRDYHSRNLMVTPHHNPGILDFQDAVSGPLTYDLVSLLKDCYIRFPPSRVGRWVDEYRGLAIRENLLSSSVSDTTFRRWFDLMGLQRHVKCAGIFSRLHLRDGKPRYLGDIPLVIDYIHEVCRRYPELAPFGVWLDDRVTPLLRARPEFAAET